MYQYHRDGQKIRYPIATGYLDPVVLFSGYLILFWSPKQGDIAHPHLLYISRVTRGSKESREIFF